jgi:hypothetical protein
MQPCLFQESASDPQVVDLVWRDVVKSEQVVVWAFVFRLESNAWNPW